MRQLFVNSIAFLQYLVYNGFEVIKMSVGENIKKRRLKLGMSAEKLSEKTGIPASTIYRYENGTISDIKLNVLKNIAGALYITPADLMSFDTVEAENVSFSLDSSDTGIFSSGSTSDSTGPMGAGVGPITAGMPFDLFPKPVATAEDYTVMLRKIGDALPRTPGEIDLLSAYRALDEEGKSALIRVARAFLVDHKR